MADFDSSLPIRTENAGDVIAKIADATTPSQQLAVDASGNASTLVNNGAGAAAVNIQDGGNSITVDGSLTVTATDLDIRDLDANQDNVAISDGTDTLAVNADGSINSVVTATDLDIRDLAFATDSVDVSGSSVTVSGSVTVTATDLDIRDLDATQDNIAISDGTDTLAINADGSINSVVTATNLDIRDLTHVSDSVRVGDGTDFLAVNTDGSINVNVVDAVPGTTVNNYNTAAAVASSASSNHDYTVTAATTLNFNQVWAAASGKLKIEVQIETGVATGVFNTRFVGFNSTANPVVDLDIANPIPVAAGVRVRVIRTNLDNQAQDLYSTICGFEVA